MATIWAVIIAGGGGGGSTYTSRGAGGGAGGYIENASLSVTEQTYNIVIGNGGTGTNSESAGVYGLQGENTTAFGQTAIGGGGSGGTRNAPIAGGNGGSGGGGSGYATGTPLTGGIATSGQGYNGGDGYNNSANGAYGGNGGGGGAGGVGGNGGYRIGGNGGLGIASSITGTSVYRASGGAGDGNLTDGTAQAGGGGSARTNGTANTGGGGGGYGGNGGSGVVIIRFAKTLMHYTATGTYSVSETGSDWVITFTGNGTFTPVYWDTISGTVTLGGTGVSGAIVRLIDQTTDTEVSKTTTDGSGNYSFTNTPYLYPSRAYHICVEYTDGSSNKYNAKSLWGVVGV